MAICLQGIIQFSSRCLHWNGIAKYMVSVPGQIEDLLSFKAKAYASTS
jgi:hypothetical protein